MHTSSLSKAVAMIWAAGGVWSAIAFFLPPDKADKIAPYHLIPGWHWYTWTIGALLIALAWVFEGGNHAYHHIETSLSKELEAVKSEIQDLKSLPPGIDLAIEEVVMHRTGEEGRRWENGELLIQVTAELINLSSSVVEYSAQLAFRGEVVQLTQISDVEEWEITERKFFHQPYPNTPEGLRPKSEFTTSPIPITKTLIRTIKNEGWLHFRARGMGDSDITKRTLRLYASNENGACYVDEPLTKHNIVGSNLVARKKSELTQRDSQ